MASGACTSGSIARPRGATRRECGGAAMTSTPRAERNRDGRDADARRLDNVDVVDADARADVARRRVVFPCHVGRDDGGDDAAVPDADAVSLPSGSWQARGDAPRSAHGARGRGLLLRLDRVRNGRLSAGRRAGVDPDSTPGANARRTNRDRYGSSDGRRVSTHRIEGASPRLLLGGTWARPYAAGQRPNRMATRPSP